ncbi:MAG: ribonuclease HI family protein [Chloroflexi bacterium]|nr:ribonuclease HI family protein [Chloroflexota bacterium]
MSRVSCSRLTVYVDGASRGNPGPAAIGAVIEDDEGAPKVKLSCYIGETTNNQAEYKALIMGIREAALLGAEYIDMKSDSELLVEQVRGNYKVRNANLKPLFQEVRQILREFKSFTITHIPRRENTAADALANEALDVYLSH